MSSSQQRTCLTCCAWPTCICCRDWSAFVGRCSLRWYVRTTWCKCGRWPSCSISPGWRITAPSTWQKSLNRWMSVFSSFFLSYTGRSSRIALQSWFFLKYETRISRLIKFVLRSQVIRHNYHFSHSHTLILAATETLERKTKSWVTAKDCNQSILFGVLFIHSAAILKCFL